MSRPLKTSSGTDAGEKPDDLTEPEAGQARWTLLRPPIPVLTDEPAGPLAPAVLAPTLPALARGLRGTRGPCKRRVSGVSAMCQRLAEGIGP